MEEPTLTTFNGVSDESAGMLANPLRVRHPVDDGEASRTGVNDGANSGYRARLEMHN